MMNHTLDIPCMERDEAGVYWHVTCAAPLHQHEERAAAQSIGKDIPVKMIPVAHAPEGYW